MTCQTCAADPRCAPLRSCAPLRCYCGHEACPAFLSWEPLREAVGATETKPCSTVWDEREEGKSWIDKL